MLTIGYKLSHLAIANIKVLKSESNEEVKLQSKDDIEELSFALSFTYMMTGFNKGEEEEVEVLKENISKVLEEIKTHIDDIDFEDLNTRLN